ncbi:hypothetical protein [Gemmatimonas sp.]|uniref:hypothetical protein n=1 Tax=Gemmatimonas sp. TaxID=1962908 RepID=UPI003DA387D0
MKAVRMAFGATALLDDERVELEGSVNVEDRLAILETEQPLPAAVIKKERAQAHRCRGPSTHPMAR